MFSRKKKYFIVARDFISSKTDTFLSRNRNRKYKKKYFLVAREIFLGSKRTYGKDLDFMLLELKLK